MSTDDVEEHYYDGVDPVLYNSDEVPDWADGLREWGLDIITADDYPDRVMEVFDVDSASTREEIRENSFVISNEECGSNAFEVVYRDGFDDRGRPDEYAVAVALENQTLSYYGFKEIVDDLESYESGEVYT